MTRIKGPLALAAGAALATSGVLAAEGEKWSYPVEVWDPPFDMASPRTTVDYEPLDKAAEKWDLCVSFPHMKDAYWMAVDYGVIDEAERQGVQSPAGRGGRLHQPEHPDLTDRGLCGGRRRRRDHRRDLARWPEQSRQGDPNQGHPGDRRDQRHLLARAVGQVARFIRRDGLQGGRVPRQDASRGLRSGQGRLVPGPARRRLGRGRQPGLPGGGQGQRDRDRRHQVRRYRQGGAAQAGRGHARGLSRTSTTSSAPR